MKTKIIHLSVALLLAVSAAGFTGFVITYRDTLFEWQWTKFSGQFSKESDAELRAAALRYYQEKQAKPGQVCVEQWAGRDERYLYMAVGCAKFQERLGVIETEGDNNFIPTRFRYDGKEVNHFEQPDFSEFENSIKKMFPREAYHLVAVLLNQEQFQRRGLELAREKGLAL
jgi:hypothetical protein